jgi:REP element-mobilizing transposase RayT
MSRARQLSFLPKTDLSHGGDTRDGKRKIRRPFDPKRAMHITLRSRRARGEWSMLKTCNKARVIQILDQASEKYHVRVHRFANVGNHLHLLISARTRKEFQGFLRVLAGQIAFVITGAKKGAPTKGGKFWDKLAYSRVVAAGRDFVNVSRYISKNIWESLGIKRDVWFPTRKSAPKPLRP